MKLQWILGGALALSIVSCGEEKNETVETVQDSIIELKSEIDTVSYALGINISEGFTKQGIVGVSTDQMTKGFNDFLSGANSINGEDCVNYIQSFMKEHQLNSMDTLNEISFTESRLDSLSYALGVNISESFKMQGVDGLNGNVLAKGFADFSSNKAVIDGEKSLVVLQEFMKKQQALAAEKNKANFAEVIAEGEKFLNENAQRPEVKTLPSGLQYQIIKEGSGEKPTMMNSVLAHYHGTLIDGTVFDSSIERGKPAEFPVGGVISGWTEALQLMPVGSKWKLYLPYNLAYGERGSGPKIGPYSALIFDVELIEITK